MMVDIIRNKNVHRSVASNNAWVFANNTDFLLKS